MRRHRAESRRSNTETAENRWHCHNVALTCDQTQGLDKCCQPPFVINTREQIRDDDKLGMPTLSRYSICCVCLRHTSEGFNSSSPHTAMGLGCFIAIVVMSSPVATPPTIPPSDVHPKHIPLYVHRDLLQSRATLLPFELRDSIRHQRSNRFLQALDLLLSHCPHELLEHLICVKTNHWMHSDHEWLQRCCWEVLDPHCALKPSPPFLVKALHCRRS